MKHIRKYFALALAFIMAVAVAIPAFATEGSAVTTGKITITVPSNPAPSGDTTYKVYKVFNATTGANGAISYTLAKGDSLAAPMSTYFDVDAAGNVTSKSNADDLTTAEIEAIQGYVENDDPVKTVTWKVGDGDTIDVDGLPFGYYYITTTTGTAVTIDSTNPNASVEDKNIIPTVNKSLSNGGNYDKDSLKAIAEVGTEKDFTAVINITRGATNIVFTDTMTNMSLKAAPAITVDDANVPTDKYTYSATSNGFTVSFDNDYIKTLEGKTIKLNYTAIITSDALSANPATNKATITYGDASGNKQDSEEVKVYNAKFTVTKKDGAGAALAGAGFVIKNADGKYYQLSTNKKDVAWVDSIDAATEYKSDAQGEVPAFTGLGVGTYTLVEKTVPGGYNKAVDSTFTIANSNYTTANLEQTSTVTNNKGTEMPSTGGIGTTIFYVVGGVMVAGAVVFLLTKRRAAAAE